MRNVSSDSGVESVHCAGIFLQFFNFVVQSSAFFGGDRRFCRVEQFFGRRSLVEAVQGVAVGVDGVDGGLGPEKFVLRLLDCLPEVVVAVLGVVNLGVQGKHFGLG